MFLVLFRRSVGRQSSKVMGGKIREAKNAKTLLFSQRTFNFSTHQTKRLLRSSFPPGFQTERHCIYSPTILRALELMYAINLQLTQLKDSTHILVYRDISHHDQVLTSCCGNCCPPRCPECISIHWAKAQALCSWSTSHGE